MLSPQQLYARILPHTLAAFAGKSVGGDTESIKQSARQLAEMTVRSCMDLGVVGDVAASAYAPAPPAGSGLPLAPVAVPGIPEFAQTRPVGPGAAPISPAGAPGEGARHYNFPPTQGMQPAPQGASPSQAMQLAPQGMQPPAQTPLLAPLAGAPVGGQQIVPPTGPGYTPPEQVSGLDSQVTVAPTPPTPNAFGTSGVIVQPEQRPSEQQTIVAPGNERMIPSVGGSGTTFVPEKIVR